MQDLLANTFLGNSLLDWLSALGVALLTVAVVRVVWSMALKKVRALAKKTETDLDDLVAELLSKTKLLFIFLIGIWAGARLLTRNETLDLVFHAILVVGLLLQAGFWGVALIDYAVKKQLDRQLDEDPGMATAVAAMGFLARVLLWGIVVLTALATVGVNITAFVALGSVGGIAVSLAAQGILGDLFAFLSIIFDKPFVLGDYIVTGDVKGNIEHVGLKTTRLKALTGEQLIVSNSDLLSSRIQNFRRMEDRRAGFTIGVTYDTPSAKLKRIPDLIRNAIERQEHTRFDRSHFKTFGPSSMDFETVFYMVVPDYQVLMDTQQAVNLELVERFQEEGIEFAYPTQTIFLQGGGGSTAEGVVATG